MAYKHTNIDLEALESIKKHLDKFKFKKTKVQDAPHITCKGLDCYTYDDIQDLYACGEISASKFDKLVEELENVQNNRDDQVGERQKHYIEHLKKIISDEIEFCLQDLGYSDEEIAKYIINEYMR